MELKPLQLRFYPKQISGQKDRHVLYMRLAIGTQRTEISLRHPIQFESWDPQQQKLVGINSQQPHLTGLMNQYRQRSMDIYQNLIQRGKTPDVFFIRERLTGDASQVYDVDPRFLELFDKVIDRKMILAGQNNTPATIQKYKRCRAHLSKFIQLFYKGTDLRFDQLNLAFIEDFEIYLRSKGKCAHNTTMKYIQTIRTIFRVALSHGFTTKDPFAGYKIRLHEVVREYLTQEEINRLMTADLPTEKLIRVRDLFIFCCFTGLAYADLHGLKVSNIHLEQGRYWIRTRRQKTQVKTNVPLLDVPLALIQKIHGDIDQLNFEAPVFPVISNQKMNAYLKDLAILCQINKPLTFHIARHTFATTITLGNGVPIESVSSMLGHKHIATTQHYAKMLDKKLEEDMVKLAGRLGGYRLSG